MIKLAIAGPARGAHFAFVRELEQRYWLHLVSVVGIGQIVSAMIDVR